MNTKSLLGRTTVATALVLALGAGLFTSTPAQAGGFGISVGFGGGGEMMRDDGVPMHDRGGITFATGMSMDINAEIMNRVLLDNTPRVTGRASIEDPENDHSISAVYYNDDGFKLVSIDKKKPIKIKMPKKQKIKKLKSQKLADGGTLSFYFDPNTGDTYAEMTGPSGNHINVDGTVGFQGQNVPFR